MVTSQWFIDEEGVPRKSGGCDC